MNGFTFRGVHSSTHGVYFESTDRTLMPGKRINEVQIPGMHGMYSLGGTTYDKRVITVDCGFLSTTRSNFQTKVRTIASWLSGSGELCFDDEPGVYYTAECISAIPLEKLRRMGKFSLSFSCDPLAHSADRQTTGTFTANGGTVTVTTSGTEETPCRITLTNNGSTTLTNITLSRLKSNE